MIRNMHGASISSNFFCIHEISDEFLKYLFFEKLKLLEQPEIDKETRRELRILELRLSYFKKYREIGYHFGFSPTRARQLFMEALAKVKNEFKAEAKAEVITARKEKKLKIDSYKDGKYYPKSVGMPEWEIDVDWGDYLVSNGWRKIYDSEILEVDIWHNEDTFEKFLVNIDLGYDGKTILVKGFSNLISLLTWLQPLWELKLHKRQTMWGKP